MKLAGIYAGLYAIALVLMPFIIGAVAPERIRWTFDNPPWYYTTDRMQRVQFGLRNDGVVVWREIVPASSATTNSPAEQAELVITGLTNLMMTNLWWNIDTNRYLRNP